MLISCNPDDAHIRDMCKLSRNNAAVLVKNSVSGDTYYFPEGHGTVQDVARAMKVTDFSSGVHVNSYPITEESAWSRIEADRRAASGRAVRTPGPAVPEKTHPSRLLGHGCGMPTS